MFDYGNSAPGFRDKDTSGGMEGGDFLSALQEALQKKLQEITASEPQEIDVYRDETGIMVMTVYLPLEKRYSTAMIHPDYTNKYFGGTILGYWPDEATAREKHKEWVASLTGPNPPEVIHDVSEGPGPEEADLKVPGWREIKRVPRKVLSLSEIVIPEGKDPGRYVFANALKAVMMHKGADDCQDLVVLVKDEAMAEAALKALERFAHRLKHLVFRAKEDPTT